MHIPDGFLSPQTCVACYAVTAPFWLKAWRTLKAKFETTTAAHVGLAAAFVFLLQMINVPIPGGTSGHAVGTAIVSIALGPAAAIVATSLALLLQAVVFGDGGIWAYGANVLVMGAIPAIVAWVIWNLVGAGGSPKRMGAAAFAAGYLAAICGAFTTGVLLGIQPLLHRSDAGIPLYFPLGLNVSIPAMVGAHALVGIVEGTVTLGAVLALSRMPDFRIAEPSAPRTGWTRVTAVVAGMVLLVPIGVVLPSMTKAGDPWGEWGPDEAAEVAGISQVPEGLAKYSELYAAPVPDYQFNESENLAGESLQYVGAALVGVLLVGLISLPLHKLQQSRLRKMRAERLS